MIQCSKCGADIFPGGGNCPKCGAVVPSGEAAIPESSPDAFYVVFVLVAAALASDLFLAISEADGDGPKAPWLQALAWLANPIPFHTGHVTPGTGYLVSWAVKALLACMVARRLFLMVKHREAPGSATTGSGKRTMLVALGAALLATISGAAISKWGWNPKTLTEIVVPHLWLTVHIATRWVMPLCYLAVELLSFLDRRRDAAASAGSGQ